MSFQPHKTFNHQNLQPQSVHMALVYIEGGVYDLIPQPATIEMLCLHYFYGDILKRTYTKCSVMLYLIFIFVTIN